MCCESIHIPPQISSTADFESIFHSSKKQNDKKHPQKTTHLPTIGISFWRKKYGERIC